VVGEGRSARKGLLRFVLEGEGYEVVGQATTSAELARVLTAQTPDAVVLDDGIGANAVQLAREAAPAAKILLVWPGAVVPVGADGRVEPSDVMRQLGPTLAALTVGAAAAGEGLQQPEWIARVRKDPSALRRRLAQAKADKAAAAAAAAAPLVILPGAGEDPTVVLPGESEPAASGEGTGAGRRAAEAGAVAAGAAALVGSGAAAAAAAPAGAGSAAGGAIAAVGPGPNAAARSQALGGLALGGAAVAGALALSLAIVGGRISPDVIVAAPPTAPPTPPSSSPPTLAPTPSPGGNGPSGPGGPTVPGGGLGPGSFTGGSPTGGGTTTTSPPSPPTSHSPTYPPSPTGGGTEPPEPTYPPSPPADPPGLAIATLTAAGVRRRFPVVLRHRHKR
jgi:hypothetical protein